MNTTTSTQKSSQGFFLPLLICSLATLFYVYGYYLRVMPSAMTDQLMHDFSIGAGALGMMASLFYYGYTPMQVPAGLLLDRLGPKRMLTIAMAVCTAATFIFGATHSFYVAAIARFFIGFSVSFAFVGTLLLASRWYPRKYFAFIVGLVQLTGALGAIAGEAPVAALIKDIGWHTTMFWSGAFGVAMTILFWTFAKDRPDEATTTQTNAPQNSLNTLQRLAIVTKNPQTWLIAIIAFASWAPISIFAALWDVPFLMNLYHVDTGVAAAAASLIWVGVAIGSPLIGWWSNHIEKRNMPLIISAALGLVSSLAILYTPHPSWFLMGSLLLLFGLAASGQALSFGVVQDNLPPEVAGTAVGFNNMAVMTGGLLFQPLVGLLLVKNWDGKMLHGIPLYSIANFRIALIILPICSIIGLIVAIFFLKETYCKKQFPESA